MRFPSYPEGIFYRRSQFSVKAAEHGGEGELGRKHGSHFQIHSTGYSVQERFEDTNDAKMVKKDRQKE